MRPGTPAAGRPETNSASSGDGGQTGKPDAAQENTGGEAGFPASGLFRLHSPRRDRDGHSMRCNPCGDHTRRTVRNTTPDRFPRRSLPCRAVVPPDQRDCAGSPSGIPGESAGSVRQSCLYGLHPAPPGRFAREIPQSSLRGIPCRYSRMYTTNTGRFCFESGPTSGPDRRPASPPSKEYP